VEATAARRGERLLRWIFLLGRLAPLSQAALAVPVKAERPALAGVWLGVFAVLAVESVLLLPFAGASRSGNGVLVVADLWAGCAALAVCAVAAHQPDELSWPWGGLLYVVSMSAVLLRDRRQVMAVAGFWLAADVVAMAARFGAGAAVAWRQVWQAAALVAFMLLVFTLAGEYRRINQFLDRAKENEVAREGVLAAERERGRHYRLLHDRVLQTMETLSRGQWVSDPRIQAQIASEAGWLRRLVSGELDGRPGELSTALAAVVSAHTAAGLTVELYAGCAHPPVSAAAVEALAGAAGEALANVRKHAGVGHAVVSVMAERGGVLVTVVDNGCGFDPAQAGGGVGIRHCLHARMGQVAGAARLDSAPGRGTSIELWAPANPGSGRDRSGQAT